MSLRKLQLLCKPAVIQVFEEAYTTDNSQKNLMLLVDAYTNAERIEDVKKGMAFIRRVLDEDRQRLDEDRQRLDEDRQRLDEDRQRDLLFHLACCQVRCAEYPEALETIEECFKKDSEFWKAKALQQIITASSSPDSQMSLIRRIGYGALTAVAAAAGGIVLLWSSPKMKKLLRTKSFPEWKDSYDLVDKMDDKMRDNLLMGAGVGAVGVGIVVVGYFTVLAKHIGSD